jgi:transcription initiation factor TFIIE subunit beta
LLHSQNDYTFKSKAALLTEIQRYAKNGGGLSVRTLKDSWRDAPAAIEELERTGDVLITRTVKDGQMRLVFWNEVKGEEEGGGMGVEKGEWGVRCVGRRL